MSRQNRSQLWVDSSAHRRAKLAATVQEISMRKLVSELIREEYPEDQMEEIWRAGKGEISDADNSK